MEDLKKSILHLSHSEALSALEKALLLIEAQTKRITELERQVSELKELLSNNSSNSSFPPSRDLIKRKKKIETPRKSSEKKRGGQPNRKGTTRRYFPADKVTSRVVCDLETKRCECGGCIGKLSETGRHHVADLPQEIQLEVTEYIIEKGRCNSCNKRISGRLPEGTPRGQYGARIISLIGLLSSKYRLSKRLIKDLLEVHLNLPISVGTVSHKEGIIRSSLEEAYNELATEVQQAAVRNVDETGYKQEGKKGFAWVSATPEATVFFLRFSRGSKVAKQILGLAPCVTISDRYAGYHWLDATIRQVCWAHLFRDFRKISQRAGKAGVVGLSLLTLAEKMFIIWNTWKAQQEHEVSLEILRQRLQGIIQQINRELFWGTICGHVQTERTCTNILNLAQSLWTFTYHKGVEPTNNLAERCLRPLVIHRKLSFGTDSKRGTEFIERIFSLIMTHKKHAYEKIVDCITQFFYTQRYNRKGDIVI